MMVDGNDRRKSFRVSLPATAFLWRNGHFAGGYPVSDISLGGCALSRGPFCDLGQRFDATLQLRDQAETGAITCQVSVVRRGADRVGLRFVNGERIEDRVHDLVVRSLEQQQAEGAQVLLVNPRPERMGPVMRALELSGHRVHLACTPLEAVWALEHQAEQLGVAVVSLRLGSDVARELLRHLADRHPSIRRVLLTEDDRRRPAAPHYADAILRGPLVEENVMTLLSASP